MITLKQELENIIKNQPFLEEGLVKGLINLSALARELKPQVEKNLYKRRVSTAALIMSLKRLTPKSKKSLGKPKEVKEESELILRNHLTEYAVLGSKHLSLLQADLLKLLSSHPDYYVGLSRGTTETTLIISSGLSADFEKIFKNEKILLKIENLSAITVRLSEKIIMTPGVYYTILKSLAWENINLIEMLSNYRELTLVFEKKDIERAFSAIRSVTT